jgi:hypothetical protein
MDAQAIIAALRDREFRKDVGQGVVDALNRGVLAATLGSPVDMATQAANLGIAGLGYLGHKIGALRMPPELIDSKNVPMSSEWIGQKMQNAGMVSDKRNPIAEALASVAVPSAMNKVGKGVAAVEDRVRLVNSAVPDALRGPSASQRGIFAGVNAKTADFDALSKAQAAEKIGRDPRQIWQDTGWFKGGDGKWRFEISDDKSFYRGSEAAESSYAQDVHLHPDLYKAYPSIATNRVIESPNAGGSYEPNLGRVTVGPRDASSTMLHEQQHAIQGIEGFADGGNPLMFEPKFVQTPEQRNAFNLFANLIEKYTGKSLRPSDMNNFNDVGDFIDSQLMGSNFDKKLSKNQWQDLNRALKEYGWKPQKSQANGAGGLAEQIADDLRRATEKSWISPEKQYLNLAGEAEARAVQKRMSMTPAERRATFPLDSYDVPTNELIYLKSDGPQMQLINELRKKQ